MMRGKVAIDDEFLRKRSSVGIEAFADPDRKLIEFIGVWDTVDAVGSPFGISDLINSTVYRFKFPSNTLSAEVAYACPGARARRAAQELRAALVVRATGRRRAHRAGVVCRLSLERRRRLPTPGDVARRARLDDAQGRGPRSAISAATSFCCIATAPTSTTNCTTRAPDWGCSTGGSRATSPSLCRKNNVAPKVHRTVFQRIARNTEGYAPGSVPPDSMVVTSSSPEMAEKIRALVTSHHEGGASLIERERRAHRLGKTAYWLMILTTLACVLLILGTYYDDLRSIPGWRDRAFALDSHDHQHELDCGDGAHGLELSVAAGGRDPGALDQPARRLPPRRAAIRSSGIACAPRCGRLWISLHANCVRLRAARRRASPASACLHPPRGWLEARKLNYRICTPPRGVSSCATFIYG